MIMKKTSIIMILVVRVLKVTMLRVNVRKKNSEMVKNLFG